MDHAARGVVFVLVLCGLGYCGLRRFAAALRPRRSSSNLAHHFRRPNAGHELLHAVVVKLHRRALGIRFGYRADPILYVSNCLSCIQYLHKASLELRLARMKNATQIAEPIAGLYAEKPSFPNILRCFQTLPSTETGSPLVVCDSEAPRRCVYLFVSTV